MWEKSVVLVMGRVGDGVAGDGGVQIAWYTKDATPFDGRRWFERGPAEILGCARSLACLG